MTRKCTPRDETTVDWLVRLIPAESSGDSSSSVLKPGRSARKAVFEGDWNIIDSLEVTGI